MNAARRNHKRRGWPLHLYEPRPGYYVFRSPDGTVYPIGRVSLARAIQEAIEANHVLAERTPTLVQRIAGAANTMRALVGKMETPAAPNTAKARRSLDKIIIAGIGDRLCMDLTVKHCAELIDAIRAQGKERSAQAVRSRLVSICRRGRELGWMDDNPAEVTRAAPVAVKRGRLTLDTFRAIYDAAPRVNGWLQNAMRLALVTGADRVTVAGMQRSMIADGFLTIRRSKTGVRIAIPLELRLDALGWSLADLVRPSGIISPYLVHHVQPFGNAPIGGKVHPDRISHAFTEARKLAGISDDAAPTFHELRSLAKRLYEDQGGVDTLALLGHATEKMGELYANPRGVEAVRVRIAK